MLDDDALASLPPGDRTCCCLSPGRNSATRRWPSIPVTREGIVAWLASATFPAKAGQIPALGHESSSGQGAS